MVNKEEQYIDDFMEGNTFTSKQVAERLHVSIWSVRAYIRDGVLPARKQGREYVVPESALRDYIRRQFKGPDPVAPEPVQRAMATGASASDAWRARNAKGASALNAQIRSASSEPAAEPAPEEPVNEEVDEVQPKRPRPASFGRDGF